MLIIFILRLCRPKFTAQLNGISFLLSVLSRLQEFGSLWSAYFEEACQARCRLVRYFWTQDPSNNYYLFLLSYRFLSPCQLLLLGILSISSIFCCHSFWYESKTCLGQCPFVAKIRISEQGHFFCLSQSWHNSQVLSCSQRILR